MSSSSSQNGHTDSKQLEVNAKAKLNIIGNLSLMLISFRCVFIRLDTKTIVIYRIDSPIYFDGSKRKIAREIQRKNNFFRARSTQEIIFNIFAYPYRHEKLFDIIHSETKDCTKTKHFHVCASKRIHFLLFCQRNFLFYLIKVFKKSGFFSQSCSTM